MSLLPYLGASGEQKTEPTQHSVATLRSIGIQPDALVLRSDRAVSDANANTTLSDQRLDTYTIAKLGLNTGELDRTD